MVVMVRSFKKGRIIISPLEVLPFSADISGLGLDKPPPCRQFIELIINSACFMHEREPQRQLLCAIWWCTMCVR